MEEVPNSRQRIPRGSLSKDVILSAAKMLLSEHGIHSLSVRKIAAKLDASAMSIYNHYSSKKEIEFALVADFVERAHQHSVSKCSWQQWMHSTFLNIFCATRREPQYLNLMIQSENVGVASMAVFDEALQCLRRAGFSAEDALVGFHKVLSFTLGAALLSVNLSSSKAAASEVSRDGMRDVTHIMSGGEFETSLKALIDTLHCK